MTNYEDQLIYVLENGEERGDRTGTGTISCFGLMGKYDLKESFPLITSKKVFFKSVVAELLWFLSGSDNTSDLDSRIWDAWANDFGDVGPIYGVQWRRWGEGEGNTFTKGIDQITEVIEALKTKPESRRHVVSAWNVTAVPKMALPPCHMFFQFYVSQKKYLNCCMYQRSADMAIGVPFNIASYALLTHLIAREVGLEPGEFTHMIGDAHIYSNHVDGVKEQLEREVRPLPTLRIAHDAPSIFHIRPEHIILENYDPHPFIKFEVAV